MIKIQLLRHATCILFYQGKRMIVDPMLSPAGTMKPIPHVPNLSPNPLIPLPADLNLIDLLHDLDGILVTHTHRDHFDDAAIRILPKDIPLFCQPPDAEKIREAGFLKVHPVIKDLSWNDITIERTIGQHGTGEIGRDMGPVAGYVLKSSGQPTLYITGDTIGCREVCEVLQKFQPDIILCFGGAAQFSEGDPITMTATDIVELAQRVPRAKVVVVHMEAWNHCRLSRRELRTLLKEKKLENRVFVPENGEAIELNIAIDRERRLSQK